MWFGIWKTILKREAVRTAIWFNYCNKKCNLDLQGKFWVLFNLLYQIVLTFSQFCNGDKNWAVLFLVMSHRRVKLLKATVKLSLCCIHPFNMLKYNMGIVIFWVGMSINGIDTRVFSNSRFQGSIYRSQCCWESKSITFSSIIWFLIERTCVCSVHAQNNYALR